MAIEIERKFLVADDSWREHVGRSLAMGQGYFETGRAASVRVRVAGKDAWLNIKSAELGRKRLEFEYAIPLADAETMLERFCAGRSVSKVRHWVPWQGHTWEVDVFDGANAGLVMAEIELDHEEESFASPPWLGREVTDEQRYYNMALAQHPYRDWKQEA